MPHIQITGWPVKNPESLKKLLTGVTRTVHETLGCPLDKISVCFHEIPPMYWADAGVTGDSPEFLTASRRQSYKGEDNE